MPLNDQNQHHTPSQNPDQHSPNGANFGDWMRPPIDIPDPDRAISYMGFVLSAISIFVQNLELTLLSTGILLLGLGSWANHPIEDVLTPVPNTNQVVTMHRVKDRPTKLGRFMMIFGVALLGIFIVQTIKKIFFQ